MGSERVAAVLRGTGSHVRLVVARPANPADPTLRPNAPILPSAMLTDREELEKHLNKYEMYNSTGDLGDMLPNLEPPPAMSPLHQPQQQQPKQQQSSMLVDQTTSPIHGDEYVAR